MDIKLKMPRTESDGNNGINDGNIETYKNKPMMSLTKEELQNSSDAALINDKGEKSKVLVEFSDYYINRDDIPDVDRLAEVFSDEWAYWDNYLKNDKKAIRFLTAGRDLLKNKEIRCLRISDFNTTGLTGICQDSSAWNNLVKNRGVSDKPTNATGSFGIGKDAAFACSELRTVFYNTYNIDDSNNEAFQGVLKLPSYKKGTDNYVGDGYFSSPSNNNKKMDPVFKNISLDPSFKRNETGLDKYIIGFPKNLTSEELKSQLIAASINNYLYAFFDDKLEVRYDDIVVDRNHLDKIFEIYDKDIDSYTKDNYLTLKEPDKISEISVFEDNDVVIYAKLFKGANRKAAITRQSGMKVFDLNRIDSRIEFSAVIVLRGNEVNGFFKKLENPEHTNWAIDRAENKAEVKRRQKIFVDELKKIIKELHQANYETAIDADGVSEYLPMTYVLGKKKSVEGLSNEVEKKHKAKKKKKTNKPRVEESEEITYQEDEQGNIIESTIEIVPANSNGNNGGGGGAHMGSGEEHMSGSNNEKNFVESENGSFISKKIIPSSNFKFLLSNTENVYTLRIINDTDLKKGFAEIFVSGETDANVIPLKTATIDGKPTQLKNNKIAFEHLSKAVPHNIAFQFTREGNWAIEVKIHES